MEDNVGVSSSRVLQMEVCTFALVLVPYTRYSWGCGFIPKFPKFKMSIVQTFKDKWVKAGAVQL